MIRHVSDAVRRHGWAFSAEQAANPEMRGWLAPDGESMVAYVDAARGPGIGRMRVAAGDPLAPAERLGHVAEAFEHDAAARDQGVIWFGASPRFAEIYPGSSLVLGAEPIVLPETWKATLAGKASLRAQIARARNKGVIVRELSDPRPESLAMLRPILDAWLATRGLPQLHFLAQPDVLRAPGDRRFLLAERDGVTVAFLSLAPVGARSAALIEWILRRPEAPNGTAALLVDAAIRRSLADGVEEVSLGLVPLSTKAPLSHDRPSRVVRTLLAWTRAHARRFYHFDGLERFKAKFQPDRWEPSYMLTTQPRVTLGTLHAVADAFAGPISAERLVTRAVLEAARHELRRLSLDARQRATGTGRSR